MLLFQSVFSEQKLYPQIVQNGQSFYSYTVSKGEGLWGISQRFGVSQAEIHQYNPTIAQGLKLGQTLLLPVRRDVFMPETVAEKPALSFREHTVEKKQTLYSISKIYNVTVDDIVKYNPTSSETLKIGDLLRIPEMGGSSVSVPKIKKDTIAYVLHEVKKKETLYSISRLYNVEINTILEFNEVGEKLKKGTLLRIPQNHGRSEPLPYISDTLKKESPVTFHQHQVLGDTMRKRPLKIAVLLPFKLDLARADKSMLKFVDFYKGSLIALQESKKMGVSTELFTFDTENSDLRIDSILKNEDLKHVDLIIGPAYTNHIPKVARYAAENHIYMLVPFSSNVADIQQNPYLLQFNPPQQLQFDLAMDLLMEQHKREKTVIAYFEGNSDKGSVFAKQLEIRLKEHGRDVSTFFIRANNVDTIASLSGNKKTILLLASNTPNRVRSSLRAINARNYTNVELLGFDDWGRNLLLECPSIYYYSLFLEKGEDPFVDQYNELFRTYFGNPVSLESPRYDMLGFDMMQYMVKMLQINRENPTDGFSMESVSYTQSKFQFKKVSENGGWVNHSTYLHQMK